MFELGVKSSQSRDEDVRYEFVLLQLFLCLSLWFYSRFSRRRCIIELLSLLFLLSRFVSTAGRSLARIMRTCSAFGGFVKSSWASAVAGASSVSITTGSALGLRRQAPMVATSVPCGCPRAWAGLPFALRERRLSDNRLRVISCVLKVAKMSFTIRARELQRGLLECEEGLDER